MVSPTVSSAPAPGTVQRVQLRHPQGGSEREGSWQLKALLALVLALVLAPQCSQLEDFAGYALGLYI